MLMRQTNNLHMKNILTSVVMPVHQVDYFADELPEDEGGES